MKKPSKPATLNADSPARPCVARSPSDRRANAQGPVRRTRGGASPRGKRPNGPARAASDDARGNPGAGSAPSTAALPTREAYAEVAAPRANGEPPRVPGEPGGDAPKPSPTDLTAMQDAGAFVNAVAAQENLVGVAVSLLRSEDEKIKQRMLERSLDMTFGKVSVASGPGDEPLQVIPDLPRPDRE